MRGWLGVVLMTGMAATTLAQSGTVGGAGGAVANPIDRRTAAQLAEQSKTLLEQARRDPQGIASVTLERYPGMMTMLTVRTKSGGAEMHAAWNDVFVVLDGEASEVTGGTIVDRKEQAGGETRGSRVEGGSPTLMRKGDVIHVSPNVPHQTVLEPGKTFAYYVIKIAVPKDGAGGH